MSSFRESPTMSTCSGGRFQVLQIRCNHEKSVRQQSPLHKQLHCLSTCQQGCGVRLCWERLSIFIIIVRNHRRSKEDELAINWR